MNETDNGYYEYLNMISAIVPASVKVYLVGGAVRDLILNKPLHDYDFILEGFVRPIGKQIADALDGKYYVMDDERDIVRVIIQVRNRFIHFDFAKFVGDSMENDLRNRDFTINAIAIDFRDRQTFVDPMGGVSDLREKRLRMCSPRSLEFDPIRALRAVRFSLEYELTMDDELIRAMDKVAALLPNCSLERYRDELFKLLNLGRTVSVVKLLMRFSILDFLFPPVSCYPIDQLIDEMRSLEHLLMILTESFREKESSNLNSGFAVLKLGAYRDALREYFDTEKNYLRSRRSVLRFAMLTALFKVNPQTDSVNKTIKSRCRRMVLTANELELLPKIFDASDAILMLINNDKEIDDLTVYRYFRTYRDIGVEGLIVALSRMYTKVVAENRTSDWVRALEIAEPFIRARFTEYDRLINPEALLSGGEIMRLLEIPAGPEVGILKTKLLEAQVTGAVDSVESARAFLKNQ